MSILKPEASIGVGLAVAGVVWSIHSNATPALVDVRASEPNDEDIDKAERLATWTSVGVVSGISLIAKDPTIFVIGGAMTVAVAWWYRHANRVHPMTGLASILSDGDMRTIGGLSDMDEDAVAQVA